MDLRALCWASAGVAALHFIRLQLLRRRIERLSAEEEQARRPVLLRQIRWSGVAARLSQLALFLFMLVSASNVPGIGWKLSPIAWYVAVALLQGNIQFRVEKRLRHTQATPGEHFRFALRATVLSLLQTACTMGATGGLCWLWWRLLYRHGMAHSAWLLWSGIGAIVLAVITLLYAVSPWLVRLSIPCEPLDDPELRAVLENCFSRAGLKVPRPYIMKLDRYGAHNAMIVGLRTRLEWLPSAVILSRTLAKTLERDEFEAVILHEASHAALKHVTKRLLMTFLAIAVAIGLSNFWEPLLAPHLSSPAASAVAGYVAMILVQIVLLRWQVRYQELEADSNAVIALGAKPEALISGLMKTMALNDLQTDKNDPNAILGAGSAHPTIVARAAELKRRVQAHAEGRDIDLRWEPYRGVLAWFTRAKPR